MTLEARYEALLRLYLAAPSESALLAAYELGKECQHAELSPDQLIGAHLAGLEALPELSKAEAMASFGLLIEAMMAYGIAYGDAHRLLARAAREAEAARSQLERTVGELDLANAQLHETMRLKTQFFANMSHELRTPLNAIIGFSEDALEGLGGALPSKLERFFTNILKAGQHLLKVINEILELAKANAGKATLDTEDVAVEGLFEELATTFEPLLARRKQVLELPCGGPLPRVAADRVKLYQVLLNLVSNAHKFTPAGGRIRLTARPEAGRMAIAVADNGVGIRPEHLAHLFDEFQQVQMPRTTQQGTGLGLAITRRLVELQGGRIWVESEAGAGSTFTFTVPLADGEEHPPASPAGRAPRC